MCSVLTGFFTTFLIGHCVDFSEHLVDDSHSDAIDTFPTCTNVPTLIGYIKIQIKTIPVPYPFPILTYSLTHYDRQVHNTADLAVLATGPGPFLAVIHAPRPLRLPGIKHQQLDTTKSHFTVPFTTCTGTLLARAICAILFLLREHRNYFHIHDLWEAVVSTMRS